MDRTLVELLPRAHANVRDFYRSLALAAPDGACEEADGLALISTGLPLADVNLAIATRLPAAPAGAVQRVQAFYRRRGVPGKLYLPSEIDQVLAPFVQEAGLEQSHSEPGMLLASQEERFEGADEPPAGLRVRVVDDPEALAAFCDVAAPPLETTPAIFRQLFQPSLLELPNLTLFLGEVDGRPVATSACLTSHGIAGIYVVATHAEYRRRGIAEFMTQQAVRSGRRDGATASYLQAWPMAVGIYGRMGYRHVVDYHTWVV